MKSCDVDIFLHDMLIFPFQFNGQSSLFIVLGAKHIKDYMKNTFCDTRPCILQILPYRDECTRDQSNAYNEVSDKLRGWLNAMWRMAHRNEDKCSMPFTRRSFPLTQPPGECVKKKMNYFYYAVFILLDSFYNSCSSLSVKTVRCSTLPYEICTSCYIYG